MALIVQKYGGTSVGDLSKITKVADKIIDCYKAGNKVLVVVSAMAKETDKLDSLARAITAIPDPRELDVLLATGEQVSIALLCIALISKGYQARSYTGYQVPICTDNNYNKAKILQVDSAKLQKDLNSGIIVVVAGFQGVTEAGDLTTVGRGGSDTTAVALAAALEADECQIYTDVDGVYTVDPRIEPQAQKLSEINAAEMLELASLGAKVLQTRSVEIASRHKVPLRVLSTFATNTDTNGTLVAIENYTENPAQLVTGIAYSKEEVLICVKYMSDSSINITRLLALLSSLNVEPDMITQFRDDNGASLYFTIHNRYLARVMLAFEAKSSELGFTVNSNLNVAKLSLVGFGIRAHADLAAKIFDAFAAASIDIIHMSTAEIKVSFLIDENYIEAGVKVLHECFGLGHESLTSSNKYDEMMV